VEFKKSIRN